ncbi:TVP38/TMEM64 family protein [Thalassobacillus sp. CUG 92003]|uniref:TVP38/TMEM64 family protein n=1 Tax=Thalassobacillus sp. CUG 92003 TaxID=2736641 RepID=UPI0015E79E7C|nr:VTT domain-containing protein [Thalassobacillus sp. CUG 92003]
MSETSMAAIDWLQRSGSLAPLLFILIHLLRSFLFIPVMVLCISGGILFGIVAGTVYSIIGIMLSSLLFYRFIGHLPSVFHRLQKVYQKLSKRGSILTVKQVTVLRLIPFIHFHLLSFCLIEISADFREYTKASLISNFPLAIVYTSLGQSLSGLHWPIVFGLILALVALCMMLRSQSSSFTIQEFIARKSLT